MERAKSKCPITSMPKSRSRPTDIREHPQVTQEDTANRIIGSLSTPLTQPGCQISKTVTNLVLTHCADGQGLPFPILTHQEAKISPSKQFLHVFANSHCIWETFLMLQSLTQAFCLLVLFLTYHRFYLTYPTQKEHLLYNKLNKKFE